MKFSIRLLYLYLFSFVGLLVVVIGSVNLVNLGLKTLVFTDADRNEIYAPVAPSIKPDGTSSPEIVNPQYQKDMQAQQERDLKRQHERQLADAVAMILVGAPLYLYHWKIIKKESNS